MEKHLKILCQNTLAIRHKNIHEQAQLTLDTLDTQKVSYAFKAWQIREKCLSVLKLTLESHNLALCNIGLRGIEYLVFHPDLDGIAGEEHLDSLDSRIFVLQVLDALISLPNLTADQQVCGLKILLSLCCDFVSSFDGELIIKIVQMCLACWHKEKNKVHSAMIQLCAAFTMHTQKLCAATCIEENVDTGVRCAAESLASQAVERLANADIANSKNNDKLADVIGLGKFFVQQIKLTSSDSQKGVFLECLLAVLKTLKSEYVRKSSMFSSYVSNDLCPTLASVISLNTVGEKVRLLSMRQRKRRRNKHKNVTVTRSTMLHRKVALVSVEVVRLVGSMSSLRPHVGLVFTHLLSSATCIKHGIPFATLNKLWSAPEMLFNLAGPCLIEDLHVKQNPTSILQLIIDAMLLVCTEKVEVDSVSNIDNVQAAVHSLTLLLQTLDKARRGIGLTDEQASCYFQKKTQSCSNAKPAELDTTEANGSGGLKAVEQSVGQSDVTKEEIGDDDPSSSSSDEDDVWVSSEDIFTAVSSPYYQSAAEDEDELNGLRTETSKLFGMMQYISRSKQFRDSTNDTPNEDHSSVSTCTVSGPQDMDSEDDISKYIEEAILSEETGSAKILSGTAESTRDGILARRYFASLRKITPHLLQLRDVAALDQTLQKLASQFCSDIYEKWKLDKMTIQAGSLYTLSNSILLLSLRLKLSGHYNDVGVQLPCVKSQWVAYQQSCGVYLSKSWLSETFREIIVTDILEGAHCDRNNAEALVVMLGDIDGLGYIRDGEANEELPKSELDISTNNAGAEFARQVLISIWSDLLQILQCPLLKAVDSREKNVVTSLFLILSPSSLLILSEQERECIVASLDALRICVKLSSVLGLHNYSSVVIAHMVEACVPRDYAFEHNNTELRLHKSQVLFMETVLDVAMEVGKKSQKCWDAVFKVVAYIAYLDHLCFNDRSPSLEDEDKVFDRAAMKEISVTDLVKDNIDSNDNSSGTTQPTTMGFLTHVLTAKSVYSLSRSVDLLFEQAALSLDLRTLTDFLWALCLSSNRQLYTTKSEKDIQIYGTPLLYRLGECIVSCGRSTTRPLLHVANIWRYAAPHFTKVLGHGNVHYAKQAGTYVYNMVTTVLTYSLEGKLEHPIALWSEQEPKYFHFIEDLLLPFERAMQSEMCDTEVQELIVGAISQLVETSSNRICSGWRPLFSALKHITHNRQALDRSPILEVLNSFFVASSSPIVLASAAHDCINCLLKLLGNVQDEVTSTSDTTPILCYLEEIATTILQLHQGKGDEELKGLRSFKVEHFNTFDSAVWQSLSTPIWMESKSKGVDQVASNLNKLTERCFSDNILPDEASFEFNDQTKLLHTWFYLLDGLTLRTLTSPRNLQPSVLELLCKLLQKSPTDSGFSFTCFVLLHSCLPTLRTFLQRLVDRDSSNVEVLSYKHVFGTLMEITASVILKNLQHTCTDTADDKKYQVLNEKLWFAYLNMCITCIQTRKEQLAKLACSCIRHIITVVGKWMTSSMIDDLCSALTCIISDCLTSLNALTALVELHSGVLDDFIIDERRSQSVFCDASSLTRVFQLATCTQSEKDSTHDEVKMSYKSPSTDIKISLCELACDVSTLSLILKCIEFMLLGNSLSPWQHVNHTQQDTKKVDSKGTELTSSLHSTSSSDIKSSDERTSNNQPLLEYLSSAQLYDLCFNVVQCFIAARRFDSLSSLQRFVQKLARFYTAANLYQFAGLSICVYFRLLVAICCQLDPAPKLSSENNIHVMKNALGNLSIHDILPRFKDDVSATSDGLKSDSPSPCWAYAALQKCVVYLCQPWDMDEPPPCDFVEDIEAASMNGSIVSDQQHSSEDSRSQHSLDVNDINLDYMAYVKRTDSIPSPTNKAKHHVEDITRSKAASKKLYKVASDKMVKGLLEVYKRYNKQRKSSVDDLNQQQMEDSCDDDQHLVTPFHRNGKLSEKSSTLSAVIALDEQLLKRQAWSSIMESILRLLTSAPDPALSVLLPVIYQPLTSLANHRPLSNPLVVGGNDVGDAFHKWLLRIGQFCDFVPVNFN